MLAVSGNEQNYNSVEIDAHCPYKGAGLLIVVGLVQDVEVCHGAFLNWLSSRRGRNRVKNFLYCS